VPDNPLILIVDDEEINLDVLEANLRLSDFRVARACDGEQALELARTIRPSLVITDILMPRMDGYRLCRELKKDPQLRAIPVIFYSATYTDDEDREFALSLGAARFVIKPEDPVHFADLIAEVMATYRSGELAAGTESQLEEQGYLSGYNRRLIAKLEDKVKQLDRSARRLEEEVARSQQAEERIRHLAFFDPLTGLPNRAGFLERARELFARASASGHTCAVLVIDVDRFREINHTLGHRNGNLLLQGISTRLRECLGQNETVFARLGGDDFALLVPDLAERLDASRLARRLLDCFDSPFEVGSLPVEVTVSAGISLYPEHGDDASLLLRHAEVAMHQELGSRGIISFYAAEDDPYQPDRLGLVSSLRTAIREGQLVLHYQPKIDLGSGATVGVEALVRWNHPEKGLVAPDAFIGLAEQTGQMRGLTLRLLEMSLHEYAEWERNGLPLQLCLNLSARNLLDEDLPDQLGTFLRQEGVKGEGLTFEITESAILQDPQRARGILERLTAMGAKVAIDDFGTGYSSLSHLKVLPVNELKIDKSFVIDMEEDENNAVIVRSTIDLAHNLGLRVTAEGVETRAVLDHLLDLDCDMAQGFLIARPMPSANLQRWLHSIDAHGKGDLGKRA